MVRLTGVPDAQSEYRLEELRVSETPGLRFR